MYSPYNYREIHIIFSRDLVIQLIMYTLKDCISYDQFPLVWTPKLCEIKTSTGTSPTAHARASQLSLRSQLPAQLKVECAPAAECDNAGYEHHDCERRRGPAAKRDCTQGEPDCGRRHPRAN